MGLIERILKFDGQLGTWLKKSKTINKTINETEKGIKL
jgi:hypothetical protein